MSEHPANCSPQAVCQNQCKTHLSHVTPSGKLKTNSWSPCSTALVGNSPAPSAFARWIIGLLTSAFEPRHLSLLQPHPSGVHVRSNKYSSKHFALSRSPEREAQSFVQRRNSCSPPCSPLTGTAAVTLPPIWYVAVGAPCGSLLQRNVEKAAASGGPPAPPLPTPCLLASSLPNFGPL